MRKLLFFLLLLPTYCLAQSPTAPVQLTTNTPYIEPSTGSHWFYNGVGYGWFNAGLTIPGGPIRTWPGPGFNPGTNLSSSQFIINTFYGAQAPTALLTGGVNLEIASTSSNSTLNWQYGRATYTNTIVSADITPGPFHEFGSQPTQPGTISGTQVVTIPATGSITFTLTVTTSDAQIATSATTYNRLPRFYYGRCTGTSPSTGEILAFAGGSNPLSASHAQGPFVIIASGSNYFFFSYPSSEGTVTIIKDVNGFDVTTSFNLTTVSLTNVSGFTQTYNIYTHNAATSGNYTITTN
jgi:hypothetical protein